MHCNRFLLFLSRQIFCCGVGERYPTECSEGRQRRCASGFWFGVVFFLVRWEKKRSCVGCRAVSWPSLFGGEMGAHYKLTTSDLVLC